MWLGTVDSRYNEPPGEMENSSLYHGQYYFSMVIWRGRYIEKFKDRFFFSQILDSYTRCLLKTVVKRNGKLVWRHGPNRPFFSL